MLFKIPLFVVFCLCISWNQEKENAYHKAFYSHGNIKEEGWLSENGKIGYWKFYHPNGVPSKHGHFKDGVREKYWYFYSPENTLLKEGNYTNGEMTRWWIFYNNKGTIIHKCQLKNGKKNGYCLKYKYEKITAAEQYSNGKKLKEWTNFSSFRRENKLSDLN